MLEVLPYLDSKGLRPEWLIRTKNYGEPPYDNIFPGIIQTAYLPQKEAGELTLEALKRDHGASFAGDFRTANRYWNTFFKFSEEIHTRLDAFCQEHFTGQTVLGVHFRGTDKNAALWETNPVSHAEFLRVVEDFLQTHPEITLIFVATDDAQFLKAIAQCRPVIAHAQSRSSDGRTLWDGHSSAENQAIGKEAILDCLTLARCRYVLKGMSALSAFSKVMNPELEAYRVSACKRDWFPEAFIPLYRSRNRATRKMLGKLQRNDVSFRGLARLADKLHGWLERRLGAAQNVIPKAANKR
jgi:hypothetical protein